MLRSVSECPYCDRGVIAVDDDTPCVIFDPDGAGVPCPHLALAGVFLEVYELDGNGAIGFVSARSGEWLWQYGQGLRAYCAEIHRPVYSYLLDLAFDSLEPHEQIVDVPFAFSGGTAEQRDEMLPGSGTFWVDRQAVVPLNAELHAYVVHSLDPAAFMAAVRRLC